MLLLIRQNFLLLHMQYQIFQTFLHVCLNALSLDQLAGSKIWFQLSFSWHSLLKNTVQANKHAKRFEKFDTACVRGENFGVLIITLL